MAPSASAAQKATAKKATAKKATAKKATAKKATATTAKVTKPGPSAAIAKAVAKPNAGGSMSVQDAMSALEAAGSEQTRKTYRRHGALDPMFGVSFATLKTLVKQIRVDHELALALWETGNHDAQTLAVKVADPMKMSSKDLDRWAAAGLARMCGGYVAMLAAEGPLGVQKATAWLESRHEAVRCCGWNLVGQLAMNDEALPDAWFLAHLERIQTTIHTAPNGERDPMNSALISIGGRNAALRKAAAAAAKKIGKVEVDHGQTACKTPDAAGYIEKMWQHAAAKKFVSPAAQERAREPQRTRC